MDYFNFTGKVAVITGGAGGIGSAVAVALAEHGADVVVTSRNLSNLEKVAEEIRAMGRKSLAISTDVTDEQQVVDMVDRVVKEFSRIDILVTSHGIALRKPAMEISIEEWKDVVLLNTMGTFICCKEVAKVMIEQKEGKIINISSIRSRFGVRAGGAAYGTSKGGIDSLTRSLACEWGQYNVYVNAVAPSVVPSDLTRSLLADPEVRKSQTARIPLGRMAELDDVTGPILFLASKASSFITGQIIAIDGGTSAGFI